MNRKPSNSSVILSKAITGFLTYKAAEGLTDRSLDSYQRQLKMWLNKIGDVPVDKIDAKNIVEFLNWLRVDYVPKRFSGKSHPLSPKTIRNFWVTLSAFFSWAKNELHIPNPMVDVPAPKFKIPPVEPFSREEVARMLKACAYTREADTFIRHSFAMKRPSALRDEAIILTLLDCGLRASELCSLQVKDVDLRTGKIEVKHGVSGGAKGGKGRFVYLGKIARRSVWKYLSEREDGDLPDAPLFLGNRLRPLTPNALRHLIVNIGNRAGVHHAYPHRFRHTMAIFYLRAGGSIFTLQIILGHNSLDMVRHYSMVADLDVQQDSRKASPVDNWRL